MFVFRICSSQVYQRSTVFVIVSLVFVSVYFAFSACWQLQLCLAAADLSEHFQKQVLQNTMDVPKGECLNLTSHYASM